MELASKPAIPEPPIAVIGQLSENWRLGFRPAESTLFQGAMPVKYLNGIRDSSSVASNSWQMSLMAQEKKPDASGTIKVDVWAPAPKDYAEVPRIMWSVVLKKNLRNAWLKATSPNNGAAIGTSTTVVFPLLYALGPAVTFSYVPSQNLRCIAPGIGASVGRTFSTGPIVGNSGSMKSILEGTSVSVGYQFTPWAGAGGSGNSSGVVSGNTLGVPGASATLTYGFCF